MSEQRQTYEIRTVMDFLAVPDEKREHMLRDFHYWMLYIEWLNATLKDEIASGAARPEPAFRWIDDGKHDATIHVIPMERPS